MCTRPGPLTEITSLERKTIVPDGLVYLKEHRLGHAFCAILSRMAQPVAEHRMSVAEYLEFEESSPIKHEYADGKLFAMAGASDEHNTISLNFGALLRDAVRGKPYWAFNSDMKVLANHVFY